ncbi:hypothetical protein SCT_2437 [Sulfuricella sp. T08]|uniref:DUF3293 domain-containing protein n=1 Tax=Sulfuricella sp. T08 TaxID=1632857 RepID=UPI0006179A88|nr:DUF3293 domain-containing protein [Sulfuricella sp. T08]GAO37022.1 hypothetical protein SCT_2437 [Sulfuricella sp. T08]
MFSETAIPAATIKAYLATDYKVMAAESFVLNVGRASPELALRFNLDRTDSAAYITAWNPFGELTSDSDNHAAQQELLAEIKALGLPYLDGEGRDPSGRWPGEPSFLVFGISLEAAKKLARQFRQNGFVYAGSDATPRLILLR